MVTIKQITNKKTWEDFLGRHPESNFLQSYTHGLVHQKLNKKVFFDGFYEEKKLVGVCLSILEPARRGAHLIVPGGPIIDWSKKSHTTLFAKHIKSLAQKNNCVFVRVRPQLIDEAKNQNLFNKLGFIKSPMHLSAQTTLQLPLNQTSEQLLAQMRKTTRYEIRQSEKLGLKVTTSTNIKDIETFCKLQTDTAIRQKFVPFPNKLIKAEFEEFSKDNQATLYTAKLKNTLLAQALIIHYPTESSYHFGASAEANRRLPGAYAIQWQIIQDARERGIPRYNFWGIVEEHEKSHRFYGVSIFKRGFGGNQVNYLPAHDLVVDKLKYIPLFLLETLRKKLRRL